jgi:hypothetical protein
MKTNKVKTMLVGVIILALYISGCGLNSSEGTMKANLRGSRSGNVLADGKKAIDLSISRPSTQFRLNPNYNGVNSFLSIAEGTAVTVPSYLYNNDQFNIFFWGDLRSASSSTLQIGNISSEQQYFSNLDKNNFQFEISIWDYYTGTINSTTKEKYDYLGYAYFGSSKAGSLSGQAYRNNGSSATIGVKFTDSLGDVIIEGDIVRNSSYPKESIMNGTIFVRAAGVSDIALGYFYNVKVCSLFKCG